MIQKLREFQKIVIIRFLDENSLLPERTRTYSREELVAVLTDILTRPPSAEEIFFIENNLS